MATPTPSQLKAQYKFAKSNDWLPWFTEAAEKAGTTTAHFLAIASRETNIKNIRGDFRAGKYHGYGPMQIDIGTDVEFAKNWTADNPEPGIKRGGEIYEEKVQQIIKGQGKRLKVRGKTFTGRAVEPDDIRRIATAAYNSGLWSYYHFSNHAHIDSSTTGKDYSRDVYRRALEFAELLEADGEDGAFAQEVELMGKYATEDDKARVFQKPSVIEPVTELKVKEPPAAAQSEKQPETPAPVPDVPDVVVTAEQPKPTNPKEKAEVSGPKSWIAAVTTFLTAAGGGIISWVQGASTVIIVGFFCAAGAVGIVYVISRYWYRNKENQRLAEVQLAREKMAHELTMLKVKSAMDKDSNTVGIVQS